MNRTLLLPPLLALAIARGDAQPSEELFRTIATLDSALFQSYNECELDKFRTFFTDDVEFYHDQGGLTVGAQKVAEQVRKNICGSVRRELVSGSMQVYPMHGYGAVQMGVHRFYQVQKGSAATGEAKFVHLWQKKDGAWKITRVISYDHVSLVK